MYEIGMAFRLKIGAALACFCIVSGGGDPQPLPFTCGSKAGHPRGECTSGQRAGRLVLYPAGAAPVRCCHGGAGLSGFLAAAHWINSSVAAPRPLQGRVHEFMLLSLHHGRCVNMVLGGARPGCYRGQTVQLYLRHAPTNRQHGRIFQHALLWLPSFHPREKRSH